MANNSTNMQGTRDVFFNHQKRTTADYYFDGYWNLSIVEIVMDALLLQLSLLL